MRQGAQQVFSGMAGCMAAPQSSVVFGGLPEADALARTIQQLPAFEGELITPYVQHLLSLLEGKKEP